jgi:hypothetical protein
MVLASPGGNQAPIPELAFYHHPMISQVEDLNFDCPRLNRYFALDRFLLHRFSFRQPRCTVVLESQYLYEIPFLFQ